MIEMQLFLGFPVDRAFAAALKQLDKSILEIFVGIKPTDYLQDIEFQNMRYLGKIVGEIGDSAQLNLLKENIYSLLIKLVPQYPSHEVELVLFPISTLLT